MWCLKEIFWLCAKWDIDLVSEYVPTEENILADTLSRLGYCSTHFNACEILNTIELCCKEDLCYALQAHRCIDCA